MTTPFMQVHYTDFSNPPCCIWFIIWLVLLMSRLIRYRTTLLTLTSSFFPLWYWTFLHGRKIVRIVQRNEQEVIQRKIRGKLIGSCCAVTRCQSGLITCVSDQLEYSGRSLKQLSYFQVPSWCAVVLVPSHANQARDRLPYLHSSLVV